MSSIKCLLAAITVLAVFYSCSSTVPVIETESVSDVPSWYQQAEFSADSLSFYGYSTAVSSDSVIAIANAQLQAKANLETALAEQFEEARAELESQGNAIATNPDFIITLREAHQPIQKYANEAQGTAVKKEGYFLGYAQVSMSKADVKKMIKSGFTGQTKFWETIQNSNVFTRVN